MLENRVIGATCFEMEYERCLEQFQRGVISESEWTAFCQRVLECLMLRNEKVLDRLKNV